MGPLVRSDEAKLLLRGDVDAAFQDAALVAKRNSRLGRKPAIIGALGSVACAISDAHSYRGGGTHEFPATPEQVLKGLDVSPAGEER